MNVNAKTAWREKRWMPIAMALLTVLAANLAVADFIQDDGYITFHYVRNWVEHGTLYYNVDSGDGAFGYTNPLYLALLAGLRLITGGMLSLELLSRVIASITLGAMCYALFCRMAPDMERLLPYLSLLALTAAIILALPYLLPNMFSGLETALFAGMMLMLLHEVVHVVILGDMAGRAHRDTWFAVALGVALGLRFDAVASCLPLAALYAWHAWRAKRWHCLIKIAAALALAAGVYLANWALTGHIVPLSLEHKSNTTYDWRTVAAYLRVFILFAGPLLIVVAVSGRWRIALYLSGFYLYLALFYGLFTRWHFYRYVFPILFPIFLLLLMDALRGWQRGAWRWYLLFAFYVAVVYLPIMLDGYSWVSGYRVAMRAVGQIAQAFNAAEMPAEDQIYASYDAGYLAYHTDWRLLDLGGLTTPEVQEQPLGQVVREVNPTVLLVSTTQAVAPEQVQLVSGYTQRAYDVPENYRHVTRVQLANLYWWPNSEYGYDVFVNERATEALVADLEQVEINPEQELGYQRLIFYLLLYVTRLNP